MRRTAVWILLSVGLAILMVSAGFAAAANLSPPAPKLNAAAKQNNLKQASPLPTIETAVLAEIPFEQPPAHPPVGQAQIPSQVDGIKTTTFHYPERCENCHDFSQSCATCHHADAARGHYPVECSACHAPPATQKPGANAWLLVRVDHTRSAMAECQSCHQAEAPPDHFQAQCSACHTPPFAASDGWLPVTFDHAAASGTDCQGCHAADRPEVHYNGQCSACHSSPAEAAAGWQPARFDHQVAGASDCRSCHATARPANHFNGQCSSCHTTASWKGARFDHQGVSNCQNCHNPPRSHWGGECKQCHRIPDNGRLSWSRLNLRWHPFDLDHGDAGGNCSTCHTNRGMNCTSCHEAEDGGGDEHDE